MNVYVFGNPDLETDSLPLKILPLLQKDFSEIAFKARDPNEDFDLPENSVIIDSVSGLKQPAIFGNLSEFAAPPNLTLHDFDLFSKLKFLQKLGKLPADLKIIGLPPNLETQKALNFVKKCLR